MGLCMIGAKYPARFSYINNIKYTDYCQTCLKTSPKETQKRTQARKVSFEELLAKFQNHNPAFFVYTFLCSSLYVGFCLYSLLLCHHRVAGVHK